MRRCRRLRWRAEPPSPSSPKSRSTDPTKRHSTPTSRARRVRGVFDVCISSRSQIYLDASSSQSQAPGLLGSLGVKWNFSKFLVDRDRSASNDSVEIPVEVWARVGVRLVSGLECTI